MKQRSVGNACGIIAIVHALGNSQASYGIYACEAPYSQFLASNSFFKKFIEKTKGLDSFAKCTELGRDADIIRAAEERANEGQTEVCAFSDEDAVLRTLQVSAGDANLDYHYVCFVNVNNTLYELDGMKSAPVNYGATTIDSFLEV